MSSVMYIETAIRMVKLRRCTQLLAPEVPISYPARQDETKASTANMTKMIVGGCVKSAMVRVTVMSIMELTAGRTSIGVAGDVASLQAATASDQISLCNAFALANSIPAALRSGSF